MSRKGFTKRPKVLKDPIFGSEMVGAYVNYIMRDGKKSIAFKIIRNALDLVKEHFVKNGRITEEDFQKTVEEKKAVLGLAENESLPEEMIGLVVLHRSIDNTRPHAAVQSQRAAGDVRQSIKVVSIETGQRLARKFMQKAALARRSTTTFKPGDKGMAKLLALEWIDAYDGKGGAVKARMDMHRMAKANQAYTYTRSAVGQESLI